MSQLEEQLKYNFKKKDLLQLALTHKSFANDQGMINEDNEKLEFLGDAVLDLVIAEALLEQFPESDEGDLSKFRAFLVNESALASQAIKLGLRDFIKLGKSERLSQGDMNPRILSSAFEAIVGAIYLDGGFQSVKQMVKKTFALELKELKTPGKVLDYKTELQELVQSRFKQTPTYIITEEEGPSHDPMFTAVVKLGEMAMGQGQGKTKKLAEQNAAQMYFEKLKAEAQNSPEVIKDKYV